MRLLGLTVVAVAVIGWQSAGWLGLLVALSLPILLTWIASRYD